MRNTTENITKSLIVGTALAVMVGAAVFGTTKDTVQAKGRTAAQEEQKEEVKEEKGQAQKEYETWAGTEEGKVATNKQVSMVSVGANEGMQGGTKIGGGVGETVCTTSLVQKIYETGANVSMGEMPYAKQSTDIGPIAKNVITTAATSRGFVPGGMFDLEIGTFTTNGGMKPCTSLRGAQTFDIKVTPIPGYTPGMLMMLPDGTTTLLDQTMFDQTELALNKIKLRTIYPKAVYMLVYMPVQ